MNRYDAFDGILDALNEAMLDDARWPETSALIDEACGSKGSVLTFGDEFPKDNIQIFFAKIYHRGEDRSEWLREYFRLYHPVDEHLPRLRTLTLAARGSVFPRCRYFRSETRLLPSAPPLRRHAATI